MSKDFKLIKLSQDRKVQGIKREKNSFGLPAISTCPGRTPTCEEKCYACKGMFTFRAARTMYKENYGALRTMLLKMPIQEATACMRKEIIDNNKSGIFRWNISGDVFSARYWQLILNIAHNTPQITFWIYTRSFKEIQWAKFSIPQNLKVILSFDKDNKVGKKSNFIQAIMGGRLVSWMGNIQEARRSFPNRKWFTCPELSGKIELQGACAKCRLCFNHPKPGNFGVHFPTNKEEGRK